MMKNLIFVFCLVLYVAAFGGVSQIQAQNGGEKVLVAGSQPLRQSQVDSIIEFYEWAFEISFSGNERNRFQSLSIEAFRQDAATSHKNAETLIKALEKVRALDEPAQRKMRAAFNEGFVKDLRAGSDAASQLLLGIYERSQQKTAVLSRAESSDISKPAKSSGGASSNKLVGKWMRSTGAGRGDDGTGKTTYSSGENTTFDFFADGTMQFTYDKKVLSITQCRISETTKIRGTYIVEGDNLMINLGVGDSVGTSSCDSKGNFKKTLSASTLQKSFVVRKMDSVFRPDRPLLLCLDGATKDDDCFERDAKY